MSGPRVPTWTVHQCAAPIAPPPPAALRCPPGVQAAGAHQPVVGVRRPGARSGGPGGGGDAPRAALRPGLGWGRSTTVLSPPELFACCLGNCPLPTMFKENYSPVLTSDCNFCQLNVSFFSFFKISHGNVSGSGFCSILHPPGMGHNCS